MIENRKKADEKQANSKKKKKKLIIIRESMQQIQCLTKIGDPDSKKSEK